MLVDALVAQHPVTVFADYDVDGASSAALLVRWFRAMGVETPICEAVGAILAGELDVEAAMTVLLSRPLRTEGVQSHET